MGKKKQGGGLGKSIIKDRFGKRTVPKGDNFLHTSELKDGYDWGRLNLQSVTEQSNLEDFLTTAELAGTEFTAEKLNIQFVDPQKNSGFLSSEEQNRIKQLHEEHKSLIRIPRRPSWNENTTAEELDSAERSSFLDWRRTLSVLQDIEGIVLTPYEKNLDFWRQLWRVIERSDVIVQVVDARNPLLFRCEDVEKYVTEVDSTKVNLVLINKADFLSEGQRKIWCDFFNKKNVRVAFWSALNEADRQAEETQENKEDENSSLDVINSESDDDSDVEERDAGLEQSCDPSTSEDRTVNPQTVERMEEDVRDTESDSHNIKDSEESRLNQCEIDSTQNSEIDTSDNQERGHHLGSVSNNKSNSQQTDDVEMDHSASENDQQSAVSGVKSVAGDCDVSQTLSGATGGVQNDGTILTGTELLDLLKRLHTGEKVQKDVTTIGMVGYPNVGKSSTINAILKMKKVPVSATPGRTKHFQTLYVENDLMLCDCPGLVFPSFVSTKAELIVNGILPIDQMRDHTPPVALVCHHIPKDALETIYGVNIPPPPEGEDPTRPPTSDEFLGAYGSMRGFMTARGLPDCPRAARYILKDYVNGRLLYCHPPPDVDAESFEPTAGLVETIKQKQTKSSSSKVQKTQPQSRLDREFFRKTDSSIHSKGAHGGSSFTRTQGLQQVSGSGSTPNSSMQSLSEKPWKKHHNRGKKEKLRKVYKDDDYL